MTYLFTLGAVLLSTVLGLSAAEQPRIVFIGIWDRAEPLIATASRDVHLPVSYYRSQDVLVPGSDARKEAEQADVLYVLNMEPNEAVALTRWLSKRPNPTQKIIPLDARGSHAELEKAGLLFHDEEVPKYWRPNGSTNVKRLIEYTMAKYLGLSARIQPSILVPDFGYYEPGSEEPFETIAQLRSYKTQQGRWKNGAPTAAILTQQSFWITHDTKVLDAEVRALEAHGINTAIVFGDRQAMVDALIRETAPDVLIEDRHGTMWDSRELLETLDVPYLRPISMMGSTIADWKKNPAGLGYKDVGMFLTVQESWSTLEPIVVGGLETDINGFHLHEAVPEGIERFAARTASWLNLRKKPNADKHVALIYYNAGFGKDDLMQGSPTGAYLDAPESAVRFLPRLKEKGYRIDRLPKDSAELIHWMRERGRNVGPWSQAELETLVSKGNPVLIPLSQYQTWFRTKLSPENQKAIEKAYGPAPGRFMVIERKGEKFIVLPRIELGNVVMMPQPERGATQDEKLVHSRDIPPPHNYLAFYWWLQEEYKADAVIHWGTHGTLEMLPGKETGPSRDDWTDILVGNMPIIDLWIMDNIAEANLARRRTYAQIVDHMVPPTVSAGLAGTDDALRSDLDKFSSLEPGLLKEEYRKLITEKARQSGVTSKLKMNASGLLGDRHIAQLAEFVREVNEARTPLTLHVLGQPPAKKYFDAYLVAILGTKFLDHVAEAFPPPAMATDSLRKEWLENKGRELLASTSAPTPDLARDLEFAAEMRARLNNADQEITGLLRALEGRYISPGPGPDPIRNPDSIPGGRYLYALNPEEIPTKPAWDVAVRLVDELIRRKNPKKVGMDLNGMDTMRDYGVMESQILYLMGVRPVWDRNGLAIDVELIPQSELKRPRIDVFIAMGGHYRENFITRVKLIDKAVRLVSGVTEQNNYVREGTLRNEQILKSKGLAADQSHEMAMARIFGTKPGNSGTNILYLIPRSGVWDKAEEIADVYEDNMSYAYTGDVWGEKVDGVYRQAIQGTDTVVRVWASNMSSQLSNHHAYEYMGGLSMAVTKLTGREPEAFIADVRDPNGARVRDFNEVLATNMETELLNKNWIEGMKEHGYAGAGHAAELVKNTFGWAVTRKSAVSDAQWNDIYSVYVKDKYGLQVAEWMEQENPHALQEMTATMLEAARKGYWKADSGTVSELAALYSELSVKHGESEGLMSSNNTRLKEFVAGMAPASVDGHRPPLQAAVVLPMIVGQKLQHAALRVVQASPRSAAQFTAFAYQYVLVGVLGLGLLIYGFVLRRGAI